VSVIDAKPRIFVFDVDIAPFMANRVFDLDQVRQYPGAEAFVRLGEVLRARGMMTVTADAYLQSPMRTEPAVCLSNELTQFTDILLSMPHVVPAACMTLESPIVIHDFYREIPETSARFRHVFLWKGARECATGGAQFHEIHWPYPNLALAEGVPAWKERRFLSLVNSNKHMPAPPTPTLDLRHPRHTYRQFRNAARWRRLEVSEPWLRSDLYAERLRAIGHFARSADFDLYGRGWDDTSLLTKAEAAAVASSYRGEIGPLAKIETLSQYKFALCLENTSYSGYITEKIFDCFAAGCIPVYLGDPDIGQSVPPDAFVDTRVFRTFADLEASLRSMDGEMAQRHLDAAQEFMGSAAARPFTQDFFVHEVAAALIG